MRLLVFVLMAAQIFAASDSGREDWIQLFNGKNLDGWIPKIKGYPPGENFANTFRVENGVMKVSYDGYAEFAQKFGHIFYKDKFGYYRLVVEYRFTGDQAPKGPGWAVRNSGAMLHCQDPKTMHVDQDFPISIEAQFLGGLGDGRTRTTANLCTPGTHVVREGHLFTPHCVNSISQTYDGDQWVRVELEVLGAAVIRHKIDGKTVLSYELPQVGGGAVSPRGPGAPKDGTLLHEGYISLQSESHPIEFRKVELLDLEGCLDPAAANYKKYFVKAKPSACLYP